MLTALLLAGSAATAAPMACAVEHARYVLRDQPGFTAEFRPVGRNADWPAGVALAIVAAKSGRTWWFLPWSGGTDGRQHVRWVRVAGDKLDGKSIALDQDFVATDGIYTVVAETPRSGAIAPVHFFVFGLAGELWHATSVDERDTMTPAFFDLVGCNGQPNAKADVVLPRVG